MAPSSNSTLFARLRIVDEHVRLENEHNLDGIMGTFGQTARYDDEPWGAHYTGRQEVRAFWLHRSLDSPSCFGLYFSIHSSRLKVLGMRAKQRGRGKPFPSGTRLSRSDPRRTGILQTLAERSHKRRVSLLQYECTA